VFVTAALHGDEINGTGAIRQLILEESFEPTRGSVILVPVLNMLAFERHSRYLPDRRDLNRFFPGNATGSLASRLAKKLFDEIVRRSDYGIDLHTAAVQRTNYPNVRGDLSDPAILAMATAFGTELVLGGAGPKGAFRREACRAGCRTILLEGGEVWKVEPGVVRQATRGVKNVLRHLDMLEGEPKIPGTQVVIKKSKWIRADFGGFLQYHVQPGDTVEKGQPLATNTTLLGQERNVLTSPFDAVVVGMSTLPTTTPGDPIFNLGQLPKGTLPDVMRRRRAATGGLEEQVVNELGANVMVVGPTELERN
jgi:predicted deacylase